MKTLPFAPTLVIAGLFIAGAAHAEPYGSWQSAVSDDDTVKIEDSFKSYSTQDNDVKKIHKEDNDYTSNYRSSEDNDVTEDNDIAVSLSKTHTEDNDVASWYSNKEDNDFSSVYTHTEDNDVSEDNDYTHTEDNDVTTDIVVDFLVATPTLTSDKYQSQDAGHEGSQNVLGAARGHEVGAQGGTTVVSAGNDEQSFYGPAMVNNNTNQLPQNNLFVQGSNGAPISQSNTFAGRDMGPKGVFAPIGNTSAAAMGDVGQSSSAGLSQTGNSGNSIADQMSAPISK